MSLSLNRKNLYYTSIIVLVLASVLGGLVLSPTNINDSQNQSIEPTTNAISSSVKAMSTSAMGDITVENLKNDYTVQRHPTNIEIHSMDVKDWPNVNAGAKVSAIIQAEVPESTYPFKYPVVVTVSAVDPDNPYNADGTLNTIASQSTEVELKPATKETDYSSFNINNVTKEDIGEYTAYVETDFTFNQQNSTEYRFIVDVKYAPKQSLNIGDQAQQDVTINGTNTKQMANISGVIQTSENYRELPTETFATSYRVSKNKAGYMESLALPLHTTRTEFSGTVKGFSNVSSPSKESATISSKNGKLTTTIATEYTERNNPQTLVIRYAMTGESDSIEVVPITASGQEIDPSTHYELTRGNQNNCINGNVTSACTFRLSETERDYINQHGELFVSLESDKPAETELVCQSVIGGSLGLSESACGLSSTKAQPAYKPVITKLTTVNSSGKFNPSPSPIELSSDMLNSTKIGIEIKNAGTAPIQANEPVEIRVNPMFTPVSEETISRTPSNLNNEVFNYTLSKPYPSKSIKIDLKGLNTNGGILEIKAENSSGDSIYKQFENVNVDSGGSATFNLSELGGYSQSITLTVNAIYDSPSSKPSLDSIIVRARDTQDVAKTTIEVGNMSGGSGSLPPGNTRRHVFSTSELDLSSLVSPAATFVGYVGEDKQKSKVRLANSDAKVVADAGGPYKLGLKVQSWEVEQTGYTTVVSDEKPGPEWTKQGSTNETTTRWVTTHINVPKTNLSTSAAIQYYKNQGYIHKLKEQLPENLRDDLTVKKLVFNSNTYVRDEVYYGTKEDINSEFPLSYSEGNWSRESFAGETLSKYDTTTKTGLVKTSSGALVWDTDKSSPVYYYNKTTASENLQVLMTAVQETPPPSVSDVPQCSASSGYPCWEKGVYMGTERTTSGYGKNTDSICQTWTNYYDPGPDWKLTGFAYNRTMDECSPAAHDVEWQKIDVTDTRDKYKWKLLDHSSLTTLHIPKYENYQKHTRPIHDMKIIWTASNSNSAKVWKGPIYDVKPKVKPTKIYLNGRQSKLKSTVPIENYQWYVDGKKINNGTLNRATAKISERGIHKVKLEVMGSGLTDTDTTTIDARLGIKSGEVHPDLKINNATRKIDLKYREIGIEAKLTNSIPTTKYSYRLRINPAENVLHIEENDTCPEGYTSSTETVNGSNYAVLESGTKDVTLCKATTNKPSGGPEEFIHPKSIKDVSARQFQLNSREWKTFWEGESIPNNGLRQLTFLDPSYISELQGGMNEITVQLQALNTNKAGTNYETVDTATAMIELCEAGTANECPAYDSDLDMALDGNPASIPDNIKTSNTTKNDQCPYDPVRDQKPCSPEEYEGGDGGTGGGTDGGTGGGTEPIEIPSTPELQKLIWGWDQSEMNKRNDNKGEEYDPSDSFVGNWDPVVHKESKSATYTEPTDWEFFGLPPTYANKNHSYYSDDEIRLVHRSKSLSYDLNTPLAHYPLNPKPKDRGSQDIWQARDVVNGQHAEAFIPTYKRNITGEQYIGIYRKPFDNPSGSWKHVTTYTRYNPDDWINHSVGYFNAATAYTGVTVGIHFRVDSGDIPGEFLGINETPVTLHASGQAEVTANYGSIGQYTTDGMKYDIKQSLADGPNIGPASPTGGSYKFGEDGFYFVLSDYTNGNTNCATCTGNTLHEDIGNVNGSVSTEFWYKPGVKSTTNQHTILYRDPDSSETYSNKRIVADINKLEQVPNDIRRSELKLITMTHSSTEDFPNMTKQGAGQPNSGSIGDTFTVLKYVPSDTRTGQYSDPYKIQYWDNEEANLVGNLDNPKTVTLDEYSIEREYVMEGKKQVIYQYTLNKSTMGIELSYLPASAFYIGQDILDGNNPYNGSNIAGDDIHPMVFDKTLNQEVLESYEKTKVPYLSLTSSTKFKPLRKHSSNVIEWKKGVIRMDFAGVDDKAYYYENASEHNKLDLEASIDITEGLKRVNNQVFIGNGWENLDTGVLDFKGAVMSNVGFDGSISDVEISQTDHSHDQSKYEPDPEITMSKTRTISDSIISKAVSNNDLKMSDVTIMKDKVHLAANLSDYGGTVVNNVIVTAQATEAVDKNGNVITPSSSEQVVWKIYRNTTTSSKTKEIISNNLLKGRYYTGFKLTVKMDTLRDTPGQMGLGVDDISIQNFIPGTYMTKPPVPVEGRVKTGNTEKIVYAPDGGGGGGSVNLTGVIDHGIIRDGQSVPVEFVVRYNNTTIATDKIELDDTVKATANVSWSELRKAGLPGGRTYTVTFRVLEDPKGRWESKELDIGKFKLQSK